ncbi:dihydroorotase [Rhodobacteraceae bacterium NNCM2]|nr:dihydroorotase [Coraliihabitans acroporae]
MHLLNARLIDPASGYDGPGAVRIVGGEIAEVVKGPSPDVPGVDCGGKVLAPGLVDCRVFVGEPGARHRESFRTAGASAAAGGVTTFVAQPDTTPCLDDPALIQFALNRAREASPVNVHVMGALTRGLAGKQMSEQQFLLDAGAVALTDGDNVVSDAKVLRAIMTYARGLGALIAHAVQEPSLSAGTCATSGEMASRLGLPAAPAIAERISLERDLALVESTGCRYHAAQISTEAALAPLARARAAGLDVSAAVSIHHLTLNEFDIGGYKTFFKLTPPLRAEDDRQAMIEAVANGAVDIICSSHAPHDEEAKRLPFEEAASGAVGLETFLPACLRLVHEGQMPLLTLFERASLAPARRMGLSGGSLAPGAPADLVLFDPDAPFVLDREKLRSKSKNTPFDRQRMQGKVLGTWVAGTRVFGG